MSSRLLESQQVSDSVRALFRFGVLSAWDDRALVALYLSRREGSQFAFEALIRRHGPMVMGVCRRVLGDSHLAEDAFQTTFVVLVRKAESLREPELLGNWLHGVAHRVASKARGDAKRRRFVELQDELEGVGHACRVERAEIESVIDEEIQRLPERYRLPFVLCMLEGLRHHEAAQRLGCPVGTVESRLSRARERLRTRLSKRGLAPAPALLTAVLRPRRVSASLASNPDSILRATMGAAALRVDVIGSAAPPLARGGVRFIGFSRLAAAVLPLVAAIGVLAAGVGPWPVGDWATHPKDAMPHQVNAPLSRAPIIQSGGSAIARPLSGITIDGDIDDWPAHFPRYGISTQLTDHAAYRSASEGTADDPDAHFMVGYDAEAGLLYLAVSVRDEELVIHPKSALLTDAVEVYLACSAVENSRGKVEQRPVLQYAAVPGAIAAYAEPSGQNPTLVSGEIAKTATRMSFRRDGNVTTYEWAIQAFDSYPGRPMRLEPGLRLGFDVAVVDKDWTIEKPAWLCWGPPWRRFKWLDPDNLGELILQVGP